jgi:hypothetical protein
MQTCRSHIAPFSLVLNDSWGAPLRSQVHRTLARAHDPHALGGGLVLVRLSESAMPYERARSSDVEQDILFERFL